MSTNLTDRQRKLAARFARQTEAHIAESHSHDLASLRYLDAANRQLATATSVARAEVTFTAADLAWFRSPVGA